MNWLSALLSGAATLYRVLTAPKVPPAPKSPVTKAELYGDKPKPSPKSE